MSEASLGLDGVTRTFFQAGNELNVLRGASAEIWAGETVALVAPSGAGKSTLLHIAGLLERPTSGEVRIGGKACSTLADDRRTALRRTEIGFVYQFHHLLPEFSAAENIIIPQMVAGEPKYRAKTRANELLDLVGLADRAFDLLLQLTRDTGIAALVATHNPDLAARMDRTLTLKHGLLESV